jgi:diaminohydroxyphosphoribosylaminopyrimidine deaminase/5-amino-6-(5-phosphoribosylamino)uracil reductase
VVVDSRLDTPDDARLLPPPGRVLFYAAEPSPVRKAALQEQGAEVALLPGPGGKVDLAAAIADLGRREVNELHVEAGHKLNGSLLKAGLVDELLVYLAPSLIGAGREMAAFGPIASLDDALRWRFTAMDRVGDDLRLLARRLGPSS